MTSKAAERMAWGVDERRGDKALPSLLLIWCLCAIDCDVIVFRAFTAAAFSAGRETRGRTIQHLSLPPRVASCPGAAQAPQWRAAAAGKMRRGRRRCATGPKDTGLPPGQTRGSATHTAGSATQTAPSATAQRSTTGGTRRRRENEKGERTVTR
eukprot:TRINITY_DN1422_c0_g1_i7.p1 TRINITY_DN1422_c0_g1~~TRINITY_DN1422_c0_g1_i7.p1  ORF type:complete len:154 (+),score=2.12 TRINITY_DN1422_c0_g1_i7:225-686(+)